MYLAESKMPEGSWKCEKCNNINYPFRTKCNRQNCGAEKPSESKNSAGMASDEDDKVCLEILYLINSFISLMKFTVPRTCIHENLDKYMKLHVCLSFVFQDFIFSSFVTKLNLFVYFLVHLLIYHRCLLFQ